MSDLQAYVTKYLQAVCGVARVKGGCDPDAFLKDVRDRHQSEIRVALVRYWVSSEQLRGTLEAPTPLDDPSDHVSRQWSHRLRRLVAEADEHLQPTRHRGDEISDPCVLGIRAVDCDRLVEVAERLRGFRLDIEAIPEGTPPATDPKADPPPPSEPKRYLMNWPEILACLREPKDKQSAIVKLNRDYDGPIVIPGQGHQPKVEKSKLLAWWNSLESRFEESEQRKRDQQATVANRYSHGKSGEVVPDIGGDIKHRRKDRKA